MKKILSSAFALIMLLSCLSVTAFAAENPTTTDKGATITVTGSYDPNAISQVVSVDVAWGAMTFTFSGGTKWDPSTHTSSGASAWTAEGNDITLTNHSNADIVAKLSFYSKISGLGGTFYDAAENGNAITDVTLATAIGTSVEEAPAKTVYFRMEQGEITQDEANLGTVYLTIIDSLTSIDATAMTAEQLQAAVTAALANEPATLHITMPDDADTAMLGAINDAIGTEPKVDLILYGMAEKLDYSWEGNITVKFICDSHDMNKETGNGTSHTLTCANCDYNVVESCTLIYTPGESGKHTTTCECGYDLTEDCTLGDISYTWAKDNATCTASGSCELCGAPASETVTAVLDTTADSNGNYYIRATFTNSAFSAQSKLSYNVTGTTYTVYTAGGLYAWGNAVKNNSTLNLTLMDDITLPNKDLTSGAEITVTNGVPTGSNWITEYITQYAGTVEGNNYKIIGLRKVGAKNQSLGGLIDMLNGGTIQNLSLEDVVVYHPNTDWYVGGLVGTIHNKGGKVLNCHVLSGSVSAGAGEGEIGGIAGKAIGATGESIVDGCTNNAKVFGTAYALGGIAGGANLNQVVSNCINYGDVSGNAEYVSGVTRIGSGNKSYTTVMYACVNYGNVSSTYTNGQVGGVTAWVNGGKWGNAIMVACANYGQVSCSATPKYIGGVAALNNERMTACYTTEGAVVGANVDGDYEGTITGSYYVGSTDDSIDGTTAVTDINTEEVVNAMNAAIETWNTNNPNYQVNYKWQIGETYPKLVATTAE